jgi:predicted MFS family arabinose efflux permease
MALLLGGVVVLTIGFSLATPALAAHLSRVSADDRQGRALGALQSVSAMARIVGPPLAGLLGAVAGLGTPFFAAAAVALAAAAITSLLRAPHPAPDAPRDVPTPVPVSSG